MSMLTWPITKYLCSLILCCALVVSPLSAMQRGVFIGLGGAGGGGGGGGGGVVTSAQATVFQNCFGGSGCGDTYGSNNASGNIDALCVAWAATTVINNNIGSVTDTAGNTWTVLTATKEVWTTGLSGYTEEGTECAYSNNIVSGANVVTPHMFAGSNLLIEQIYELHGQNSSTPIDINTGNTGTGANPSGGTVTTSFNGEYGINISILDDGSGIPRYSVGAGWTSDTANAGGFASWAMEHISQSTAGSLSGNFSASAFPWTDSFITIRP